MLPGRSIFRLAKRLTSLPCAPVARILARPRMEIELINAGSELLLGRVLNTHQQWLGETLSDAGYILTRQETVPDTAEAIARR